MNEYEKLREVVHELRRMVKELNITIITARQPTPVRRIYRPPEHTDDFIFIDYVGLIR